MFGMTQGALVMRGKKLNRAPAKRLHFQPLEKRQMLADLGLQLLVVEDPGDTTSTVDLLTPGDPFWLQLRARDVRTDMPVTPGVISLPVNINLPNTSGNVIDFLFNDEFPALEEPPETEESPISIPSEHPAVTSSFPFQRFVNSYDLESIDGLRGGAIPSAPDGGSAIGGSNYEEFSRWQFAAVGAGYVTPFTVELAGSMAFADGALLNNVIDSSTGLEVQVEVAGRKLDDEGNPLSGWEIFVFRDDNGNGKIDSSELADGPFAHRPHRFKRQLLIPTRC